MSRKRRRRDDIEYTLLTKNEQMNNISNILQKDKFTDVTFMIGTDQTQKEFRINRIFLAAISNVFEAMLYGNMMEGKRNAIIKINDIATEGFESVINYAYLKNPQINISNICAVKHICRKYQIIKLSKICDDNFDTFATINLFCKLFNDSVKYRLDDYVTKCKQMIKNKYGMQIVDILKQGYLELDLNTILILLKMDDLEIKEEELWEFVVTWATFTNKDNLDEIKDIHKHKRRKLSYDQNKNNIMNDKTLQLLKQLSPFIRFGLMDGTFFVNKVQNIKCLTNDEIRTISNYILCDRKGIKCGKFSIKQRAFEYCIKTGNIIKHQKSQNDYDDLFYIVDICFTSNTDITLKAIGFFNCLGQIDISCKIFDGNNDNLDNIIYQQDGKEFHFKTIDNQIYQLVLDKPVFIKKNINYTLEIWYESQLQTIIHRSMYSIDKLKSNFVVNGIKINFSNAIHTKDYKYVQHNGIPALYFTKVL